MRLFNDMVTPSSSATSRSISRVNGMRIGGGQEIGMACDFSIAQDLAMFGQAGPRHGSAPDGGSTDFLPLFVGFERAMESGTLCEPWSAHKAHWLGLLTQIVPALKVDGHWSPNPLVVTDRMVDDAAASCFGEFKRAPSATPQGARSRAATIDLSLLDARGRRARLQARRTRCPECLSKTIESVRKHKLGHWDTNSETNRAWLALNMMTEARAGFRAFNEGTKECREVDFLMLRRRLAEGAVWSDELIEEILQRAHGRAPVAS